MKNSLTVFTPTYNRKTTIERTFLSLLRQDCTNFKWLIIDDGSLDGTRVWVEQIGKKIKNEGFAYDWMGRRMNELTSNHFVVSVPFLSDTRKCLQVEYIYKPNGGLYTGYNVAYDSIDSELCMCIDSDDYLPGDAIETILTIWNKYSDAEKSELAGIIGLDYNVVTQKPIGGFFNISTDSKVFFADLHHIGDEKYIFRTDLMKTVSPQIGFEGEKDFNPHYMQMQIFDKYKVVAINKNFCWVEYQLGKDSMSQAIFKQYVRSPKSYVQYRLMEMSIQRGNTFKNRFRLCIHYISACIFSNNKQWFDKSPYKLLTLMAIPFGVLFNVFIRFKSKR